MNKIIFLLLSCSLTSCSLLHSNSSFEMEKLSEDVLSNKKGQGISITIIPIDESKK